MFRFVFRLLAMAALAIAVIMAVLDTTRTVAASRLVLTPLGTSWTAASPDTLSALQLFVAARMHPLVWDPVIVQILDLPGFLVFGGVAFLLYAVGHRPQRPAGRFVAGS